MTAGPDWLSVAFQICVTVCDPGHEYPTLQPAVVAVPGFVTVKPSWNPPDQEFVTDQLTEQAAPVVLVAVGLGLGGTLGLGLGDTLGLGLGLGDWLGLGLGLGVGEGCPLPLVRTTIDSAGTLTDVPEKLPATTDGFAAE